MIDGLVVTDNKKLFDDFNLSFTTELSHFEHADSVESAKKLSELETFDCLFLVAKESARIMTDIELLADIPAFKGLPILCALPHISQDERKILWEAGVKDLIRLPVAKEELKFRLDRFLLALGTEATDEKMTGMQGKLEDYSLVDIVQTLEQNKKSGVLTLYHGRDEGRIWFKEGIIYDATFRTFQNIEAIFKLMTWTAGDFTISFVDENYERKIFIDNQQILLDAMQHIDKRNKRLDLLPPEDEILLISPEADMEEINPDDNNFLRFFQGGQTIFAFLASFDNDELMLLDKVTKLISEDHLMTREQFDSHTTVQEREIADTGLKTIFKKLFKSKDDEAKKPPKKATTKAEAEGLTDEKKLSEQERKKLDNLFDQNQINIDTFRQKIEKI